MNEHQLDSERALLGAMYLNGAKCLEDCGYMAPDDFIHPLHRAIWKVMNDEWVKSSGRIEDGIGLEAVEHELQKAGYMDALTVAGGMQYLCGLYEYYVPGSSLQYHAKRVKAAGLRYRWGMTLSRLSKMARGGTVDDEEFGENIGRELWQMMLTESNRIHDKGEKSRKDVIRSALNAIEESVKNRDKKFLGVPTGFMHLDSISKGLRPGQLVVVAARPGMGKSAFMNQVLEHAAQNGCPGLLFSLEMLAEEVGLRSIAAEGVNLNMLQNGKPTVLDWSRMNEAGARLIERDITTVDIGSLSLERLRSTAKRWRMSRSCEHAIIAVDYLQLVKTPASKDQSREQQVAEVSRTLKEIAQDLRVPVLAVAQLNRNVESRQSKIPGLGDLRESGQIEQDADIVMFLHRKEVYEPDNEECKGEADVVIAKARSMPTASFKLRWQPEFTRFVNTSNRTDAP
jgi:replicative DNA helicase